VQERPAIRYYGKLKSTTKQQLHKPQKPHKLQKPICHNTTIRSILDGHNQENKISNLGNGLDLNDCKF